MVNTLFTESDVTNLESLMLKMRVKCQTIIVDSLHVLLNIGLCVAWLTDRALNYNANRPKFESGQLSIDLSCWYSLDDTATEKRAPYYAG